VQNKNASELQKERKSKSERLLANTNVQNKNLINLAKPVFTSVQKIPKNRNRRKKRKSPQNLRPHQNSKKKIKGVPGPASTEFLGAAFTRDPVRAGRVLLAPAGLPGPCSQVPAHPCHAPSRKSRHPRNLMQKYHANSKKKPCGRAANSCMRLLLARSRLTEVVNLFPLTRHGIL